MVANREHFGDGHPYAPPIRGTVSTCRDLTLDAVATRARQILGPSGATLLVAGDIDRARLERLVSSQLGEWKGPPDAVVPSWPGVPDGRSQPIPARPFRIILVPRADAVQTVVRFQWPGPAFASPDRLPLGIVNTVLGGSFTSRLNQNLREEHGYTYGAGSRFTHELVDGYATASASVRADVTAESLKEFLGEFERLRAAGISQAEHAKAVATIRNGVVDATEGLDGILSQAAELIVRGRSFSDFDRDFEAIGKVAADTIQDASLRHVRPRDGLLVLVGDEAIVREQINALDLGPIEVVDPQAAPGSARP
jgi:predicted Zn-dependent peptidase